MCGIFGIISSKKDFDEMQSRIKRAHNIQMHRGPDMWGEKLISICNDNVLYLAHQRLSIFDLTEAGKQPMTDLSHENWIVYNGEVYNFKELAEKIGFKSNGGSDTEVILEYFRRFGVQRSLPQFNGMWSFAFFSVKDNILYLARDRAGVKPLYYAFDKGRFFFASEIKTILALIGRRHKVNLQVVGEYLNQSLQDTSDCTFFQGINSLTAGAFARINLSDNLLKMSQISYWDPVLKESKPLPFGEVMERVKSVVYDSVSLRLRADVPVGILLSGGLDSSIIAAMAKKIAGDNSEIKILSAVSPGQHGDESYYIDIVAKHLNLDVTKVDTSWDVDSSIELLRNVTWFNDAPLGSFSNVAFYLLMKRATELDTKVILSGQGGDELFCGYRKYLGFYLKALFTEGRIVEMLSVGASFFANGAFQYFSLADAKRYLPGDSGKSIFGPAMLGAYTPLYLGLSKESVNHRQWKDYRHYSVPYLTHYEDRASMAFAREVRLPFLDYRLVELMLSAPMNTKLANGWTKYSLRKAFSEDLPPEIIWRKDKQGFSMPQEEWLRGKLKPAWLDILNPDAQVFKSGILNYDSLIKKFNDFCAGKNIWYREIFSPLALEIWFQQYAEFIEF